jgi:uncharacterized membrane protein AbrB (regulator of aidB expression)
MQYLTQTLQLIVAFSVFFVWTFRIHNVIKEFQLFGINEIQRSIIGVIKVALSTLLVVGVWYSDLVFIPACLMACFMLGAQYFHYTIKAALVKRLPSFVLLICSLIILINTIPQ